MAGKTMRAVQYSAYGEGASGLKHVNIPVPAPKKDEILVKVEAASINPMDWKIQKGMLRPFMPSKFPFTPVNDIAGEVTSVGSGVGSTFKSGDKVVALLPGGGGLAEYAVAPANFAVRLPHGVSTSEAAALPTAAVTAVKSLKAGGVNFDGPNKVSTVLVTAASGGVGHYAVQLAKVANLHVTATCGARNIELVRSLGADEVLDYKSPDGKSLKSPSGRKYDVVINCATGISWSTFQRNLSSNGKVIELTPSMKAIFGSMAKNMFAKKKLIPMMAASKVEDLKFVVELTKEGRLRTVVDSKHALSKAESAWAKSMDGRATGKIIVEV